jgi:hypothetical protein
MKNLKTYEERYNFEVKKVKGLVEKKGQFDYIS